jgi:triosephosphate isomerase (TIM)
MKYGPLAQLVEHLTFNQRATGSNPVGPTSFFISSVKKYSMSCFYLISNWKMNGSSSELCSFLKDCLPLTPTSLKAIICPSYPFLHQVSALLPEGYTLGAQDCSALSNGAYTGQVSASMLKEVGCSYVLIGHCERRSLESQEEIIQKKNQAQESGLTPILCIGEDDFQNWEKNLRAQIKGLGTEPFILAYEPVWAVGKNVPFNQSHAQRVFQFLKEFFPQVPLLYGGSVTSSDLKSIHSLGFSGALLGRAGRNVEQWNAVLSECLQTI